MGELDDKQAPGVDATDDRLDSWKEIASFFGRGVTTVQRWEEVEALPVHRHEHAKRGTVYAFKSELKRWHAARAVAASPEPGTAERPKQPPYKGFISYSHAAQGALAPVLQSALQQFAKPFYRLRAIRVFRDETSLALTPGLWPTIQKALRDSEYFILIASPSSAASEWVQKEVGEWLRLNGGTPDKLLIVLAEGQLAWSRGERLRLGAYNRVAGEFARHVPDRAVLPRFPMGHRQRAAFVTQSAVPARCRQAGVRTGQHPARYDDRRRRQAAPHHPHRDDDCGRGTGDARSGDEHRGVHRHNAARLGRATGADRARGPACSAVAGCLWTAGRPAGARRAARTRIGAIDASGLVRHQHGAALRHRAAADQPAESARRPGRLCVRRQS